MLSKVTGYAVHLHLHGIDVLLVVQADNHADACEALEQACPELVAARSQCQPVTVRGGHGRQPLEGNDDSVHDRDNGQTVCNEVD